jgi:hypothetical protein
VPPFVFWLEETLPDAAGGVNALLDPPTEYGLAAPADILGS